MVGVGSGVESWHLSVFSNFSITHVFVLHNSFIHLLFFETLGAFSVSVWGGGGGGHSINQHDITFSTSLKRNVGRGWKGLVIMWSFIIVSTSLLNTHTALVIPGPFLNGHAN